MAKHYYFVGGKVKCKKEGDYISCVLEPSEIEEKQLIEISEGSQKYIDTHKRRRIPLKAKRCDFSMGDVHIGDDSIVAKFRVPAKYVCILSGSIDGNRGELLSCGLSAEEKEFKI